MNTGNHENSPSSHQPGESGAKLTAELTEILHNREQTSAERMAERGWAKEAPLLTEQINDETRTSQFRYIPADRSTEGREPYYGQSVVAMTEHEGLVALDTFLAERSTENLVGVGGEKTFRPVPQTSAPAWRSLAHPNMPIPVRAYYQTRVVIDRSHNNMFSDTAITGLHSSGDYGFEFPIGEMVEAKARRGEDILMPPLTNVVREYRYVEGQELIEPDPEPEADDTEFYLREEDY